MSLPKFITTTRKTIQVAAKPTVKSFSVTSTSAAASRRRLSYPAQTQLFSQWCWAAVATSVAEFFDASTTWTQCSVAAHTLIPAQDCCKAAAGCNQQASLGRALTGVGHLDQKLPNSIAFSDVQAEIDDGRPVGIRRVISGLAHCMVIFGYIERGGRQFVLVADPAFRISRFEFRQLGAKDKSWTHSYITQR